MNTIMDDFIVVVNSDHKVDVFKRGDARKLKTLDIDYMRYSLLVNNLLFIGTEEKMLYLVDALTFEILDRMMTQSFIFTICKVDDCTVACGEYQGFVDVVRVRNSDQLVKVYGSKLLNGNIYKIIKTDRPNEFCFGCGNGMFFGSFEDQKFNLGEDKIFSGKYVTQICLLPRGTFLCSIWNQSGVFLVERNGRKPIKVEDPRYNSHTTDLKPLFPENFTELPYVVARNKNSINLIDLRNRHI